MIGWRWKGRLVAAAGPLLAGWAALAGPQVDAARVIAALTGDWNADGGIDRALLVASGEGADLLVLLSDGTDRAPRLAVRLADAVRAGSAWGTLPSLGQNAAGSLLVRSGNDAIGRHRWQEVLTVAFRGGRLVVAGFTFESRDTLEPGLDRHCDVNFLTGRGVVDGEAFAVPAGGVPLADWGPERVPERCAAG